MPFKSTGDFRERNFIPQHQRYFFSSIFMCLHSINQIYHSSHCFNVTYIKAKAKYFLLKLKQGSKTLCSLLKSKYFNCFSSGSYCPLQPFHSRSWWFLLYLCLRYQNRKARAAFWASFSACKSLGGPVLTVFLCPGSDCHTLPRRCVPIVCMKGVEKTHTSLESSCDCLFCKCDGIPSASPTDPSLFDQNSIGQAMALHRQPERCCRWKISAWLGQQLLPPPPVTESSFSVTAATTNLSRNCLRNERKIYRIHSSHLLSGSGFCLPLYWLFRIGASYVLSSRFLIFFPLQFQSTQPEGRLCPSDCGDQASRTQPRAWISARGCFSFLLP